MKIQKYLKKPEGKLVNFQTKLDADLVKKVKAKKRTQNLKWDELVEAMFKAYLDEK